jgi:PEP-CTERM motif
MKLTTRTCLSALLLLTVVVGSANASASLWLNWHKYGGSAKIAARYNGSQLYQSSGNVGLGSFAGVYTEDGVSVPTGALYCLDVFHSFSGTPNSWDVTERYLIPPDPDNPPPWNTAEAAWAYNRYNKLGYSNNGRKAAGLQLALWEISHDQDWRVKFGASNWHLANGNGGSDFYLRSTVNSTIMGHATSILGDVFSNFDKVDPVYYYDPSLGQNDYSGAQGFIGEVPEPGVLMLMGMGILAFAGITWRRRKQ